MQDPKPLEIIECPRDAMQGIERWIPTELKVTYLNALLKVGFHTLDFGSFVSPKAVPQMADTAQVVERLDLDDTPTQLLAIVVNHRGAEDACAFSQIDYLGYPFSVSETFQLRNARKSIADSLEVLDAIQDTCEKHQKDLRVYLSMAFGNPYGDAWSPDWVEMWAEKLVSRGIKHLSLADTMGLADIDRVDKLFRNLLKAFPEVKWSAHFHAHPRDRVPMIEAAYSAGCRRFETAIRGFGGCPFAEDDLVGNIATESLLEFFGKQEITMGIDFQAFAKAVDISGLVFQ